MRENKYEQARKNFKHYLEDGLIKKEIFKEEIYQKLYENSLESLRVANNLYNNEISFLWTIVTSYYSMFYIANAYIYKKGYKVQKKIVHKIVGDTLIILAKNDIERKYLNDYEEEKDKALELAGNLIDTLEFERTKRSTFQYEMGITLKKSRANTSINRAKEFIAVFREVLP